MPLRAMNTAAMLAVQSAMKRLLAAVSLGASLAAGLAGCAAMQWTRGDATPEQLAADMRACRDQAWRATTWNSLDYYGAMGPPFFSDPFGRRYFGWPHYSPFGDRFLEEARLADFCMRAKGYELAPVTQ